MTTPKGVPRDLYDDVVRQRDEAVRQLYVLQAKYAELAERAMGLKAQEMGAGTLNPAAQAHDPMAMLGPRTQMAVEEFAQGDPELRNRLVSTAMMLTSVARNDDPDLDDSKIDAYVAARIREGDQ